MSFAATRSLSFARGAQSLVSRRLISTTPVIREAAATPNLGSVPPPKRPVGAFRGGYVVHITRRFYHALRGGD